MRTVRKRSLKTQGRRMKNAEEEEEDEDGRSHSVTLIPFVGGGRRRKSMVMALQQAKLQLELKAADRRGRPTQPSHNALLSVYSR